MRSPATGDRVRAVVDRRDGTNVEGFLRLRHIPSLGYAQVVVRADGRLHDVRPDSIEILEPAAIPACRLDTHDLAAATAAYRELGWLAAEAP